MWVHVTRSLVFCVMFCRSLFVHLSFFFWPLCCLSFDLQILITPLVSSNSTYLYTAKLSSRDIIMNFVWKNLISKITWFCSLLSIFFVKKAYLVCAYKKSIFLKFMLNFFTWIICSIHIRLSCQIYLMGQFVWNILDGTLCVTVNQDITKSVCVPNNLETSNLKIEVHTCDFCFVLVIVTWILTLSNFSFS
jgi:hypothetical protein